MTQKTTPPVKFEPKDGKVLVFAGQSVDATLDYYRNLPGVPRPAGFSDYVSYDIGTTYRSFAADYPKKFEGNDGLFEVTNWGSGNQCVACNLVHDDFSEAAINIGLYIAGPIYEDGSVCTDSPECNTYKIAQGLYDDKLNEFADWLLSLNGRPVFLRTGYEFDGDWNGYTPDQFKAAYKHIYRLFKKRGVDNVAYVLHTAGFISRSKLEAFYPEADEFSDSYVDWLGFSYFSNKGKEELQFAREHNLKVFIGEAAPHTGESKEQIDIGKNPEMAIEWINEFFDFIETNKDVVRGFAYINENWSDESYSPQWLNQNDQGCDGFFSESNSCLKENQEVLKLWAERVSHPLYQNWEPGLYDKLYR